MALSRFVKAEARKLYLQGVSCQEIAEELEINIRTMQRWAREFDGEAVVIPVVSEVEPEPPIEALQRVAEPQQPIGESIELNLTARIAVRLLNLTEVAIDTVEEVLTNGDATHGNKLKAAQMVAQWVGLDENNRSTVMSNVTHKLGLNCADDYEENQAIFTPRRSPNS
ncbi:MAG: helix-turn-helix domain-containing protein [Cyanobacteria bacterium P01_C01_bin.38]